MTPATKFALLSRLVGLFGEIEALARRARQGADMCAKSPFSKVHTDRFDLELSTILQVIDQIRIVLRQLD